MTKNESKAHKALLFTKLVILASYYYSIIVVATMIYCDRRLNYEDNSIRMLLKYDIVIPVFLLLFTIYYTTT